MAWCYFNCHGFPTGEIIQTNKSEDPYLKNNNQKQHTGSGEWRPYRGSGPLSDWWIAPPAGWRGPGCRGWNLSACLPQTWCPGTPGRPERGGRPGQRRRAGGWGRVSGFCSGGGGRHVTIETSYQGILFHSCLSRSKHCTSVFHSHAVVTRSGLLFKPHCTHVLSPTAIYHAE